MRRTIIETERYEDVWKIENCENSLQSDRNDKEISYGTDLRKSVCCIQRAWLEPLWRDSTDKRKEILTEMLNHSRQESIWPTWIFRDDTRPQRSLRLGASLVGRNPALTGWTLSKHLWTGTHMRTQTQIWSPESMYWFDQTALSPEVRCHPQWINGGSIMNGKAVMFHPRNQTHHKVHVQK